MGTVPRITAAPGSEIGRRERLRIEPGDGDHGLMEPGLANQMLKGGYVGGNWNVQSIGLHRHGERVDRRFVRLVASRG